MDVTSLRSTSKNVALRFIVKLRVKSALRRELKTPNQLVKMRKSIELLPQPQIEAL